MNSISAWNKSLGSRRFYCSGFAVISRTHGVIYLQMIGPGRRHLLHIFSDSLYYKPIGLPQGTNAVKKNLYRTNIKRKKGALNCTEITLTFKKNSKCFFKKIKSVLKTLHIQIILMITLSRNSSMFHLLWLLQGELVTTRSNHCVYKTQRVTT